MIDPERFPDWLHEVICFVGGVVILIALLMSMGAWPTFHILGD